MESKFFHKFDADFSFSICFCWCINGHENKLGISYCWRYIVGEKEILSTTWFHNFIKIWLKRTFVNYILDKSWNRISTPKVRKQKITYNYLKSVLGNDEIINEKIKNLKNRQMIWIPLFDLFRVHIHNSDSYLWTFVSDHSTCWPTNISSTHARYVLNLKYHIY